MKPRPLSPSLAGLSALQKFTKDLDQEHRRRATGLRDSENAWDDVAYWSARCSWDNVPESSQTNKDGPQRKPA